jgi:hypothetical protein
MGGRNNKKGGPPLKKIPPVLRKNKGYGDKK